MGLTEKCGVQVTSGIFAIPFVQRKSRQNRPSGAKKLTSAQNKKSSGVDHHSSYRKRVI
jgi:hypothetical protein